VTFKLLFIVFKMLTRLKHICKCDIFKNGKRKGG